jgi:hypothetical protein
MHTIQVCSYVCSRPKEQRSSVSLLAKTSQVLTTIIPLANARISVALEDILTHLQTARHRQILHSPSRGESASYGPDSMVHQE